jgi:hypothetical protein
MTKRVRTDRKHVWHCWSVVGRVSEWRCPNCGAMEVSVAGAGPPRVDETCDERVVRLIMEE